MKNNIIPFQVTEGGKSGRGKNSGNPTQKERRTGADRRTLARMGPGKAKGRRMSDDETYTRLLDDVLRKADRSSHFEHILYYGALAIGFSVMFGLISIAMWRLLG